ncbi:fumarylacetoacetate hydrolase family protein [Humitalea sp. 24SJ18S-53]|uniref:fumarylacetoacetate hydrolase family protein n=1 Tax=Humitalea sp. 24SJ18S-53 TaxID=3422307 RepID=UPI003D664C38
MRLVTFDAGAGARVGVVLDATGASVLDLHAASGGAAPYASMLALIAAWPQVKAQVAGWAASPPAGATVTGAKLLAPIPRPAKNVFCVGRNYQAHINEGLKARGAPPAPPPALPEFFTKPPTAVIGPDEPTLHFPINTAMDYEVELVLIIGTTGRDIVQADALKHIFGYTVGNDVTARRLQRAHGQWFKGKGLDKSCPLGPWIVTADALDPMDLQLTMTVNGELRQDSRTSNMIFPIPSIIEHLSAGLTLEAGDIVMTGTPHGVGYAMDPPQHLKAGDKMEAYVEGIGTLRTPVIDA